VSCGDDDVWLGEDDEGPRRECLRGLPVPSVFTGGITAQIQIDENPNWKAWKGGKRSSTESSEPLLRLGLVRGSPGGTTEGHDINLQRRSRQESVAQSRATGICVLTSTPSPYSLILSDIKHAADIYSTTIRIQ
jgi:hypothetical protein